MTQYAIQTIYTKTFSTKSGRKNIFGNGKTKTIEIKNWIRWLRASPGEVVNQIKEIEGDQEECEEKEESEDDGRGSDHNIHRDLLSDFKKIVALKGAATVFIHCNLKVGPQHTPHHMILHQGF